MTNPEHHWYCKRCGRRFTPAYRDELILVAGDQLTNDKFYHLSGPNLDGEQRAEMELEFTDRDGSRHFAWVCGPLIFEFANPKRLSIIDVGKVEIFYDNTERINPVVNVGIRGTGRSVQGMKIKIPRTKTRKLEIED